MTAELKQQYEDLLVEAMSQIFATGKAELKVGEMEIVIDYRDRLNEHAAPQR